MKEKKRKLHIIPQVKTYTSVCTDQRVFRKNRKAIKNSHGVLGMANPCLTQLS